jgi:prepilin-type N-terminal cleavage/methylation domain-containing protein
MKGTEGAEYRSDYNQLFSPPLVEATIRNSPPLVGGARGGGKGEWARGRGLWGSRRGSLSAHSMAGFTLIELMVAIALGLVILAGLFRTFKVQQDSYLIQDQVSAMQQNLRAAMYMITRDLQMAGYYTNLDLNNKQMDWNDLDGDSNPNNNMETGRPLIFGVNNITSGGGIKNNTDLIVIVKASLEEGRLLKSGESASGNTINLLPDDLNIAGAKYGVLVKDDLNSAELFHLDNSGKITPPLTESYFTNDRIHRADIIIYRVEDSDPAHPRLVRKNLGSDNGYQVIAENIDNLKFRYQLNDGTWVNDPAGNQARVRAVEVLLVARTASPQRGYRDTNVTPNDAYRRKTLTTIIKTRNINAGLQAGS